MKTRCVRRALLCLAAITVLTLPKSSFAKPVPPTVAPPPSTQSYSFSLDEWGDSDCWFTNDESYGSDPKIKSKDGRRWTGFGVTPGSPHLEIPQVAFEDPLPPGSVVTQVSHKVVGTDQFGGTGCGIYGTVAIARTFFNNQMLGDEEVFNGRGCDTPPLGMVSGTVMTGGISDPQYNYGGTNYFNLTLDAIIDTPQCGGGGVKL